MTIKQVAPAPGILLQILTEIHWQQIKLSERFRQTLGTKPLPSRECWISGELPAKVVSIPVKYVFVLYAFVWTILRLITVVTLWVNLLWSVFLTSHHITSIEMQLWLQYIELLYSSWYRAAVSRVLWLCNDLLVDDWLYEEQSFKKWFNWSILEACASQGFVSVCWLQLNLSERFLCQMIP